MMKRLLTTSIIALLYLNAQCAFSQVSEELLYNVKKNDTVWAICKAYVNDPLCWKKLVEYNQLANPKYLPPNSIIRIPKAWLIDHSTTALVIAVEGEVLVVRDSSALEERLSVGDQLSQQDVVKSMNGTAMIQFADDSRLLLKANSSIRMASLQFYDPSQFVNTRVELLKGRVKAQVEKLTNKNSQYLISTPAAVAAVRGTEFRVARSEIKTGEPVLMRTELLSGALEVASDLNKQNIVSGQAVLATEGKGVGLPVKLLPRPLMALNESQSMALPLILEWHAIDKAKSYKVTLMTADSQVWEKTTLTPELLINDLNPGQYEVLIRGVDEQGFEGQNRRLNLLLPDDNI
ncbi:MAG: FecR domain-containing protein [Oleispira sp.]